MNSGKTLFVHAGGTKTGSTAIQNFCELHAAELSAHNFAYKNTIGLTHDHQFTFGNGKPLFDALQSATVSEEKLDEIVSGYFGPCNNAICSSEYFENLTKQGWQNLILSSRRLNIVINVVYFIRSVVPFFLSAYDQAIKHHGEYRSLDEWSSCINVSWNHVDALHRLEGMMEELHLKVLSYDHLKNALLDNFFTSIGCLLKVHDSKGQRREKIVNRSLSNIEREVLRTVNQALGYTYSAELSDLLIYSEPEAATEHVDYSASWLESMATRYETDVNWVNEKFGNGLELVYILPPKPQTSKQQNSKKDNPQSSEKVMQQVLQWAVSKLESIQLETRTLLVRRLQETVINGRNPAFPDLPADFNPLAYLIMNPDVLFAELDPAEHYCSSGKREGRSYLFKNSALPEQVAGTLINDQQMQTLACTLKRLNAQIHDLFRLGSECTDATQSVEISHDHPHTQQTSVSRLAPLATMPGIHAGTRTNNSLIVVLGMHRSGTSAITRALQVFDIRLGDRLMEPLPDNEKGFWEDLDLNALNMEMLDAVNASWHTLGPIDANDLAKLLKSSYFPQAVSMLCKKTDGIPLFGFKDPRIAKLLPFWKAVFAHCGFNVHYVIALRNPLSVSNSLSVRDNFDHRKSYALWISHLISSLQETRGANRLLVDYDQLMNKPDIELNRIASTFDLAINLAHKAEFTQDFLEEGLRHSVCTQDDLAADPHTLPLALEMYVYLTNVAHGLTPVDAVLDAQTTLWASEFERQGPLLLLADELYHQQTTTNELLNERNATIARLERERAEIDNTFLELNAKLAENEIRLAAKRKALSERDKRLEELAQFLSERDIRLSDKAQSIAERDRHIAELLQTIDTLNRSQEELEKDLAKRDEQLEERHCAQEERNKLLAEKEQAERRLVKLNVILEDRNQQYAEIRKTKENLEQLHMDCLAELAASKLIAEESVKKIDLFSESAAQAKNYSDVLSEEIKKLRAEHSDASIIKQIIEAFRSKPHF